jgi:hypothetical protein
VLARQTVEKRGSSYRADATELRVDLLWRDATAGLGVARHRLAGEEEAA